MVEILAVVSILAVLTALLVGMGQHTNEKARLARARTELAALAASLEAYRIKYGDYPHTDRPAEMLQALIGRRGPNGIQINDRSVLELARFTTEASADPFRRADAVLTDPWATPYEYRYRESSSASAAAFVLYSSGPDRLSAPWSATTLPDFSAPENIDNLYANR